ncbi:Fc receptor-like protein 2 [Marmota monax]|uniref:Fc receptor-like protein 2 n=1 Tax=Marmota monax TaxID=9995 RepID=UPI0026EB9E0D|nr:Fc receptor-like protein 2 [Marmota monax]
MLLWLQLLVLAPASVQSGWLSISIPYNVYEGDQVVIRCSGETNDKINRLTYYKDGFQISTYHNATSHTISNARRSDSGSYFCKAERTLFPPIGVTEETRTTWLIVRELFPTPELRARPLRPTEGCSMMLSCNTQLPSAKSSTQLRYSFIRDGHTLRSGWTSARVKIPATQKKDSGHYWCEARTASRRVSKQSRPSYIEVQRVPVSQVSMKTQPPGVQAVEGEMLVLVCSVAKGTGVTTFSWHREDTSESLGRKMQCSQRAELEIPVVRGSHGGGFYCTADNSYGPVQSQVVNVTVRVPVSHPILTFGAPGTRAFMGPVMELHCEDGRASPPILYWFYYEDVTLGNSSAPFGGGASFNFSLTANHSGSYFCKADNGLGARHSELMKLSVTDASPKVRLMNGPHRCEGRVEMKKEGHWGTVCDDGWDMKEVAVVCRELGCGAGKRTPAGVLYQPGAEEAQPVHLQEARCNGTERTLAECKQTNTFNCGHEEDAGAACEDVPLWILGKTP